MLAQVPGHRVYSQITKIVGEAVPRENEVPFTCVQVQRMHLRSTEMWPES